MPSRKQRRRREKSFRHEYETVLLDEEGNELPIDPEELRAEREERERQRAKPAPAKGKQAASKRGGRTLREPAAPSWQRAFRRGGLMGAVIFVAFVFVLKGGSTASRALIAGFYAVAFIPLTYWVDRFAYRSYQKRVARGEQRAAKKKT
jgi:hypothetical protein